ncbi:MAG: polysaccharide deacetylase family protein [Verrucomicrobiia bacterium]
MVTQGENGSVALGCRRILRSLLKPKRTLQDFETILALEGQHGFRSTFFILHDRYFARQGARFSIRGKDIREIGRMAVNAGCELGVHGGYYRFNNVALYRESKECLQEVFGVNPVGIRNHLLRFSYPETWLAQEQAGFEYDTTYGYRSVPGPRSGLAFPFFPYHISEQREMNLLELPLTVMDTTIFRYLRLKGEAAFEFTWKLVERLARHGALITLLWHNNFFNEPEYWDWQMVYQRLLERLAALKPWCATGAEINHWWRARRAVQCRVLEQDSKHSVWSLESPVSIRHLALLIRPVDTVGRLSVEGTEAAIEKTDQHWCVRLPHLSGGERVRIRAEVGC